MDVKLQASSLPKRRGCGTRVKGGFYMEVPLGYGGRPVWDFVPDPLVPFDTAPWQGIRVQDTAQGQVVLDWVGASHYPYPADFIYEAQRLGISRRVPKTQVHLLKPGATLVLVHARVIPGVEPGQKPEMCMVGFRNGEHVWERCCGWLLHVPGEDGVRTAPGSGVEYAVSEPGAERWTPGIFMVVPLRRVVYVRGAGEERDAEASQVLEALASEGLETEVVDE